MLWSTPRFPVEPPDPRSLRMHQVDGATLTRPDRGDLRVLAAPMFWVRGAVYDHSGMLLEVSQRIGGLNGDHVAAADPKRIAVKSLAKRPGIHSEGTWLYGGHWMPTFGHFITETLTTLWPQRSSVDGLVFHAWNGAKGVVHPWQQHLVNLAGYHGLPVVIVDRQRITVEHLLVPERAYVTNGWAHEEALGVWRRVARRLHEPRSPARVYFSRTRHNAARSARGARARTSPERDATLDRDFERSGFAVVAPEELEIEEQVRFAAGAQVLAGPSGSGLHLACFAARPARVIEVGDTRADRRGLPNQQVIDSVCGHKHAFIPDNEPAVTALEGLDLETDFSTLESR